jgi:UDP-N-acetylmuramate-alanine ligase
VRQRGAVKPVFAADPEEALVLLGELVSDGDILLVQGAGSVNQISQSLVAEQAEASC